MNKSQIYRAMVKKGDTQYRSEQMLAEMLLKQIFPNDIIELEVPIFNLKTTEGQRPLGAKPDIVLYTRCTKCKKSLRRIFRMQGGWHRSSRAQIIKAKNQRERLEDNGYLVRDFNDNEMPSLWEGKDLTSAVKEIMREIRDIL